MAPRGMLGLRTDVVGGGPTTVALGLLMGSCDTEFPVDLLLVRWMFVWMTGMAWFVFRFSSGVPSLDGLTGAAAGMTGTALLLFDRNVPRA